MIDKTIGKRNKKLVKTILLLGSCEGEDRMLLQRLPAKGKYLDIGCSTPIKYNNTYLLYLNGWSGICVDVRKIRRFKWIRPRDKFVQATVTDISEYKDYDLLDIDVDGIDLDILKTMAFHPKWILAECNQPSQLGIPAYLESLGYKITGMTSRNRLFEKT